MSPISELLLRAALVVVFALFGFQVWTYLAYVGMAADLDEYESKALDQWRRPMLPLVYEQRARLRRALAEQRVILVINSVCCLALLWANR